HRTLVSAATVDSRLSGFHRWPCPPSPSSAELTMTHQHGPVPDAHLETVAEWHPIEGTPAKKKVAIGCSIGATIETYDFIGYGTAAALYFDKAFFPTSSPLSATLLSFATLRIGF